MDKRYNSNRSVQIISTTLKSLAQIRIDKGAWEDSETESTEKETLAYKIGESIRPFLIAKNSGIQGLETNYLEDDIIISDLASVFSSVKRDSFYPSPYSPIPNPKEQYVDFCCFIINLSLEIDQLNFFGTKISQKEVNECLEKAIKFLLNPNQFYSDPKYCCWGGTSKYFVKRMSQKKYYTDTYFTSLVVLSLYRLYSYKTHALKININKDEIKKVIQKACMWIIDREKNNLLCGNEDNTADRTEKSLMYTAWGLRAIITAQDLLPVDCIEKSIHIAHKYIETINTYLPEEAQIIQNYIDVVSPTNNNPLYYEERSGIAGFLFPLLIMQNSDKFNEVTQKEEYRQALVKVFTQIVKLMNPTTNLWYNNYFILSIHHYIAEAFISFTKEIQQESYENFEINAISLRSIMKEVLEDKSVFDKIYDAFYEKLMMRNKNSSREVIENSLNDIKKDENFSGKKPMSRNGRKAIKIDGKYDE